MHRSPRQGEVKVAVVVMAKRPVPGQAKTRLCGELSADDAAALYKEMLADRCAQVASLKNIEPAIAYANGEPTSGVPGFCVVPQCEDGLGAGLKTAAEHFLCKGMPVLLVDSDSVTLPTEYLEAALAQLRPALAGPASDVVIGPCEDGGYYLLGLTRFVPELFDDIPWSTPHVAETTVRCARRLGHSVHVLPTWWDVDTPADVMRLRRELSDTGWPKNTSAWFRSRAFVSARKEG